MASDPKNLEMRVAALENKLKQQPATAYTCVCAMVVHHVVHTSPSCVCALTCVCVHPSGGLHPLTCVCALTCVCVAHPQAGGGGTGAGGGSAAGPTPEDFGKMGG